ncbi:ATP-binding protein [Jeotgalibaca sp. MA1X17-3]|uniref:ATP-binding protein n=1 Tax=Jeotgalibaca sp. MA1X17-3 TaxID=2908211 RepID=UPI001F15F9D9|nr:ATP-binding protein [Jeotgalibaca sp. MA1X17-3]UJF14992.1 ATP-binding protein [Jeotgalibaca sp. MA1X17-3]
MTNYIKKIQKDIFNGEPIRDLYLLTEEVCNNTDVHAGSYKKFLNLETKELTCPCCVGAEKNEDMTELLSEKAHHFNADEKRAFFKRYSIYGSKAFVDKGFKDYQTPTQRERDVKASVSTLTRQISEGEIKNSFFSGNPGTGKSMLAHASASNISTKSEQYSRQLSCMFVDFTTLLELIIESYNNKATDKKTDAYYLKLMKEVDVLYIDDIGTDIGKMDTSRGASDHTVKTLFKVINARDGIKSTILTSNLSYDDFKKAYDPRISSRLSQNLSVIDFDGITDKRPNFF